MGTGSEPRIISTMASKSSIQQPSQVSLVGNPEAEDIYRELLAQHKARKLEDPVIIVLIGLSLKYFSHLKILRICRSILSWIRVISK